MGFSHLSNIYYTLIGGDMSAGDLKKQSRIFLSRKNLTFGKRGTSREEVFMAFVILTVGAIIITLMLIRR